MAPLTVEARQIRTACIDLLKRKRTIALPPKENPLDVMIKVTPEKNFHLHVSKNYVSGYETVKSGDTWRVTTQAYGASGSEENVRRGLAKIVRGILNLYCK